jgi:hypothetical protein
MAKKSSNESKPLIITLVFMILALIGVSVYLYILIGEKDQYTNEKKKADEDVAKEKEVTNYHKFLTRALKSYIVDVNDETKKKINDDMTSFKSGKLGGGDPEKEEMKSLLAKLDASLQQNPDADSLLGKDDPLRDLMPKDVKSLTRNWGKDPAKGIDLTKVNSTFSTEVVALREALRKKQDDIVSMSKDKTKAEQDLAHEKELRDADTKAFVAQLKEARDNFDQKLAMQAARIEEINKQNLASQQEVTKSRNETQDVKKQLADSVAKTEAVEKELDNARRLKTVAKEDFLRFEKPRGEVSEVQRGGNVILKLPSTRRLEVGTTLSVRGINEQGKPLEKVKGNLKVTEIGNSYCIASVVDQKDTLHDPIVRGDKVFSLTWDPDQQKHIVLLGVMDDSTVGTFNAAESNRQLLDLKRTFEHQGAIVDAYLDLTTFKLEGKFSVETDYIVLGRTLEKATVKTEAGDMTMNQAVSAAINEGIRNGVLVVPLRRYMAISGSPLPSNGTSAPR